MSGAGSVDTMTTARILKVLVVDDSPVARLQLTHILESDPQLRVVAALEDGEAAVAFVQRHAPDVVLMDLQMPRLDGFEATRRIMETHPVPIVVCSGTAQPGSVALTFRVMEAGALTCVPKPVGHGHPDYEATADQLRQTVKLMAEVKVVRRWARHRARPAAPRAAETARETATRTEILGIGASTGGPQALQQILAGLPKGFPVPILVVQHISPGFLPGLADWLGQTTGCRVHIGAYGMPALPGHVYLAPDDFHMGVTSAGALRLTKEPAENGLRPSVSYLFRSLAEEYGASAVGVLLTGMGKDGAAELSLMRQAGAVTIAQDEDTSVVFGMPGEAVRIGAASHVTPLGSIAPLLASLTTAKELQP
jgi:two-component system chemotaxis response regulator CheB